MNPIVSIVIPVYNVEKYLERCLDSLVNQTYTQLEIILVDDGSTDASPKICETWASGDNRIKVIHKQNAGAGLARDTGLEFATGDYVLFVDSDDYMDVTTVEKCVTESQKHNADVVMFGRCNVLDNGTQKRFPLVTSKLFFEGEEVVSDILNGLFTYQRGFGISVWGKLFKRSIISDNHLHFESERTVLSEDALFCLHAFSYVSRVSVLPENLYYYCQNGESLSRKYKAGHQERNDAFWNKSKELCEVLQYPTDIVNSVCARYHMYALSGMKRIIGSSLSRKEKQKEMKLVFNNRLLRSTILPGVIQKETKLSRLFWQLFRFRLYHICYFLLWSKVKRKVV